MNARQVCQKCNRGGSVVQVNPAESANASVKASEAASGVGTISISAEKDDLEVFVDGEFIGNTPAKLRLTAGMHIIEAKKAGFKDYRKQIKVTDGADLTVRLAVLKAD